MRWIVLLFVLGAVLSLPVYAQEPTDGFNLSFYCRSDVLKKLFNLLCDNVDISTVELENESPPGTIQLKFFRPPISTKTPTPMVTPTIEPGLRNTPTPGDSPGLSGPIVFAAVYGRPSGWGSLARATTPEKAIEMTKAYAARVATMRGGMNTVGLVNPNIVMNTGGAVSCSTYTLSQSYIAKLIQLAKSNRMYVMLDVQTGSCNPLTAMKNAIDKFLIEDNVFFDIDVEWIRYGGSTTISSDTLSEITRYYTDNRTQKGFTNKGYVGFYIFNMKHVTNPSGLKGDMRDNILPLFDGFGPCSEKRVTTRRMVSLFGKPYGGMEFETKWGTKYDKCSAANYFAAFPDFTVFSSQ